MDIKRLKKLARRLPHISVAQSVEFITLLAAAERANELSEEESKEVKKAFGQAFKNMRLATRLTQKQFCEKAGLSQQQLSALESGKAGINAYAPAFFALGVYGTSSLLEKASELEASWGTSETPVEA